MRGRVELLIDTFEDNIGHHHCMYVCISYTCYNTRQSRSVFDEVSVHVRFVQTVVVRSASNGCRLHLASNGFSKYLVTQSLRVSWMAQTASTTARRQRRSEFVSIRDTIASLDAVYLSRSDPK